MSMQRCDTSESESDQERCRWNNLIEMKANIHSATSPINKGSLQKKTAIIVTLSLSHFTPTLPKEIGTVIIGTKSM